MQKFTKEIADILIKDRDWRVRAEVARQGYGLDILVYDEDCDVRYEVVKQGYGLDILVDDEDCDVRDEAIKQLKKHLTSEKNIVMLYI